MSHPMVVHCKKDDYDVYIGRPLKWGNPLIVGRDGTRKEVIRAYVRLRKNNPEFMQMIRAELRGKVLGYFCDPDDCHGDFLAEVANEGG